MHFRPAASPSTTFAFPFPARPRSAILDEPHDAAGRYPMLEKPDQPLVRQPIKEAAHVQVQHPVTRRSWSPQNKASALLCWLRFGRNPIEKPRKSVS